MNLQPIMNFLEYLPRLITKDQKENTIYTIDDVRGDVLGPPYGTTPAVVNVNKNKAEIL